MFFNNTKIRVLYRDLYLWITLMEGSEDERQEFTIGNQETENAWRLKARILSA